MLRVRFAQTLEPARLAPAKEVEKRVPAVPSSESRTRVPRPPRARRRLLAPAVAALGLALAATACGSSGEGSSATTGASADAAASKTLVVATHDSWAMSKKVLAAFTAKTGITVQVQPQGDAGTLTNKLVLTKDSPLADGVYGIDNTFASRAVDAGLLVDYTSSALPAAADRYRLSGDGAGRLTPVDFSDVCVNVDDTWFAKKGLAPPVTLDDLVKPAYRGLFVTPGATTSSPGLAFLLATVAAKGDAWPTYWKALMANDTSVVSGWSDAYEVDFTAGGGHGDRPIVTSYSSSPPFTIPDGASKPTTSALLDTCYRQVEYAGCWSGRRTRRAWRSSSTSCSAASSRPPCRTTCTSTPSTLPWRCPAPGPPTPRCRPSRTPCPPTRWPRSAPSGCASGVTSSAGDPGRPGLDR